ncbi:tetrapyrrole biosynthesis, uroporphyrinogen III synthase [Paxillus ammoniavirescens]|nr:tetrapyrrole biosynthesis, uroporphyrinogen III synthase [Paxillus ammoniavirescens]
MKHVLLLRAPAEEGPDRYELEFETRGYTPLSIPVLETVPVSIDILKEKILHGPNEQALSGVIITSKRAVEAWSEALEMISQDPRTETPETPVDWGTVPFYVVGEATAAAASKIQTNFPSFPHLPPVLIRGGSQSGTAERLAHFILEDVPSHDNERRKLLYLTGDKNRDTLPQILSTGNIDLDALEVYRTKGSSSFLTDLKSTLERAPIDSTQNWGWVVYFAPSAAEFVTPFLHDVFEFGGQSTEKPTLKIAVIGPTTASFLRDTLKLQVDVVSSKPTPESLSSAVVAFDSA